MKRAWLLFMVLALGVSMFSLVVCSADDDDDDDDNNDRGECETLMEALYNTCGYAIEDWSLDKAIDECVDASEEEFECVAGCYEQSEYCDDYANCLGNNCL